MRTVLISFIAVLAVFYTGPLSAQNFHNRDIRNISVYGGDNRKDYFEVGRTMKFFANSTVSLFTDDNLIFNETNNTYEIGQAKLGTSYNLKRGENFYNQPIAADCSGALVGEDMIFTAGHCTDGYMTCDNIKVVFGYAVKERGVYPVGAPAENVYSCKERIAYSHDENGDYALLKLDRKVSGYTPLAINRNKDLKAETKLFVIGYPSGLPVKIAGDAKIRFVYDNFFIANLDTFGGNSGSPVFNSQTGLIEGILVAGADDYDYDNVADTSSPHGHKRGTAMRYNQNKGREWVAKISLIENLIPRTELETAFMEMQKANNDLGRENDIIESIQLQYQGEAEIVPAVFYPEPELDEVNVYKI